MRTPNSPPKHIQHAKKESALSPDSVEADFFRTQFSNQINKIPLTPNHPIGSNPPKIGEDSNHGKNNKKRRTQCTDRQKYFLQRQIRMGRTKPPHFNGRSTPGFNRQRTRPQSRLSRARRSISRKNHP